MGALEGRTKTLAERERAEHLPGDAIRQNMKEEKVMEHVWWSERQRAEGSRVAFERRRGDARKEGAHLFPQHRRPSTSEHGQLFSGIKDGEGGRDT